MKPVKFEGRGKETLEPIGREWLMIRLEVRMVISEGAIPGQEMKIASGARPEFYFERV